MKIKLPRTDKGRFRGFVEIDETHKYFKHWLFGRFRRAVLNKIKSIVENA